MSSMMIWNAVAPPIVIAATVFTVVSVLTIFVVKDERVAKVIIAITGIVLTVLTFISILLHFFCFK